MVVADLVAGTMAGFAICGVGHPFDTLKVLMQMQPDRYKSMVSAGRETIQKHGFGGLYKGVASPAIGNGVYNAVQFAVFARLKSLFTDNGAKNTLNRIAGAAAFTGIFVALVEGVSRGLRLCHSLARRCIYLGYCLPRARPRRRCTLAAIIKQ